MPLGPPGAVLSSVPLAFLPPPFWDRELSSLEGGHSCFPPLCVCFQLSALSFKNPSSGKHTRVAFSKGAFFLCKLV